MNKQKIAVWFSCGAASAVAAKITLRKYGDANTVRILNTPIAEEDDDNRRFLSDVQDWLGVEIEPVVSKRFPKSSCVEVWDVRKAMSFPHGAPCTVHLKKEARQDWEQANPVDWHVLGFTVDEIKRHERFTISERSNVLPVLINANLTKDDCAAILHREGLELPAIYREGYPNANCIGCVKATSPTYWNLIRRTRPKVFQERAEQSRRLGVKLVRHKGARIFLDELPESAQGRPLKALNFECGLFCEEWSPANVQKTS